MIQRCMPKPCEKGRHVTYDNYIPRTHLRCSPASPLLPFIYSTYRSDFDIFPI